MRGDTPGFLVERIRSVPHCQVCPPKAPAPHRSLLRPHHTQQRSLCGLVARIFLCGEATVRYNYPPVLPPCRNLRREPARCTNRCFPHACAAPPPSSPSPGPRSTPPRPAGERRTAGVSRYRLRTAGRLRADRPPGSDPGRRRDGARPGGDARAGRRHRGKRARRRRGHAPRRGRPRRPLPRERQSVPAPGGRLRPRFDPAQARDLPGGRLRSRGRRGDREGVGPRGRGGDDPAFPGDRPPRLPRGRRGRRSSKRRE